MRLAVAAVLAMAAAEARALAADRFWTDAATGFAIGGYDPIAYFADNRATVGSPEYQLVWRGVAWRFTNPGNLAAFRNFPEIYAPEYGGYGAIAVAKGHSGAGNPEIWAKRGGRLYLFCSLDARRLWESDPERWIALADRQWRLLRQTLPD